MALEYIKGVAPGVSSFPLQISLHLQQLQMALPPCLWVELEEGVILFGILNPQGKFRFQFPSSDK